MPTVGQVILQSASPREEEVTAVPKGYENWTYRCKTCGQIVLIMEGGEGELICCNKPMIRKISCVERSKE